jgi:hypothetical protein
MRSFGALVDLTSMHPLTYLRFAFFAPQQWALIHAHTLVTGVVFSFMVWSCLLVLVKATNAVPVRATDNTALRKKRLIPKHSRKVFAYGTMTMTLLIISMLVQLYLAPLFIHFGDDSDEWLECVQKDWQSSRGVGSSCDYLYPSSRPPVSIMSLRYFSMSAVPLVVGTVFGIKFLPTSITKVLSQVSTFGASTGQSSMKVSAMSYNNRSSNNSSS